MPEPQNIHELKSLEGRITYFRRFISNLAGKYQPFSHLMKKDTPFKWDQAFSNAFESIKSYLMKPSVLAAPIPGKPLILYIAAQESHFGKNKLSGEIPTSLFHSNLSLIHLRLDRNSFSGSVPEMLNDLTHVQEIHSSVLNYFALSGFIDQYDLSYGLSFDTYGEYYKNMREFYQYLPRLLKPVVEANETVASRTVVRFGYTKPKLALVFANLLVDPYQIMMANVAIETPLENLEPVLQENIQKLWDSDPKLQAHKGTPLSDFFNVEVVALSSYQEKEEQFKEQVASLRQRSIHSIAPDRLGGDRRAVVLALGFTFSAKEIWNIANENKDLDLPAHKVMVATVRCEEIFHYLYRK
ncbi:hypothetical protein T459_23769 [Capsicum annuum]|uniref:GB1/RHD3-type G domain-containing protein n=1 Tax=Capsicum annuum TaxID=4072 RepID=A0A2G2YTG5_CAPAN|nr:hypothetical protein T459_23769 [Capsicum annuum]